MSATVAYGRFTSAREMMMRSSFVFALGTAAIAANAAIAADPATINWSVVPVTELTLFYPGQSSYEWLRSDAHKGASRGVQRGDACVSCHDETGAEIDLGDTLVKAGRLESTPVGGKPGHSTVMSGKSTATRSSIRSCRKASSRASTRTA
jgi:hypothetical protein